MKRLQFCSYLAPNLISVYELATEAGFHKESTRMVAYSEVDACERIALCSRGQATHPIAK